MRKIVPLMIIISLVFLEGCAQERIVDDVSLIRGVSYDLSKKKKIKIKVAVPIYKEKESTKVDFYTGVANTSKGAKAKLNAESPRAFASGQQAISLYGSALAKDGIIDIIDTLHRDPHIGNRLNLAVVDGKASELLTEKLTTVGQRPPMYMSKLIDQNEEVEAIPKMNLHVFLYSYYSDGKDPYLPLLKKQDKHVEISGIALFKDDKYVELLPLEKAYILKILSEDGFRSGTFEVKLEEKNDDQGEKKKNAENHIAVIENVKTKVRSIVKKGEVPTFHFDINFKGLVKEYTGELNDENSKRLDQIKQALEEKIINDVEDKIDVFQKKGIDPIGLGELYRSSTRNWDPKEWRSIYPSAKVKLSVNVEIVQSGVVE